MKKPKRVSFKMQKMPSINSGTPKSFNLDEFKGTVLHTCFCMNLRNYRRDWLDGGHSNELNRAPDQQYKHVSSTCIKDLKLIWLQAKKLTHLLLFKWVDTKVSKYPS